MQQGDTLLIVDVQNDFCPGGSLPVAGGDQIVPVINAYARRFDARGLPVIASRDWHPAATRHFVSGGGVWPPHGVQDTSGAAFHADLRLPIGTMIVSKGMDPQSDSYSAFDAVTEDGRSLGALLKDLGTRRLLIGGLATDYCVHASALAALAGGFTVVLLSDAMRGVELQPGDSERAVTELHSRGATAMTLAQLRAE